VSEIRAGDHVIARSAKGDLERRAATGVMMGGDFEVVWVVRPEEWEAAKKEGRDPEAIPWPAEDVIPFQTKVVTS
jgi:hypothetical protein